MRINWQKRESEDGIEYNPEAKKGELRKAADTLDLHLHETEAPDSLDAEAFAEELTHAAHVIVGKSESAHIISAAMTWIDADEEARIAVASQLAGDWREAIRREVAP